MSRIYGNSFYFIIHCYVFNKKIEKNIGKGVFHMSSESTNKKAFNANTINSIIGMVIMFIFPHLPITLPQVTPVGMQILGIFLGTLYLWSTVDALWASVISIGMVGLSDFAPMGQVLATAFGNPVVVQMAFMMVLMGVLVYSKVTLYIGRFFMTRKIVNGRPWIFTLVILIGCYIMSIFIGAFAPIFLFWPVMYGIFDQIGYTKEDKYPRIMLILIVLSALAGFPVPPYMSNGLALLSNYRTISEGSVTINDGSYFMVCSIMGLILVCALVLIAKFVFRPNVDKLKAINVDMLKKNPLPPMDKTQKIISVMFVIYVCAMLFPTLLPAVPGMKFLAVNSTGIALIFVAVMAAIRVNGNPVLPFGRVMEKNFAYSTFFLCTTAILLGSVLTNEATGISAFLNQMLTPIFTGMSTFTFTVVLLLVAVVLTNLCNSLVIGMILQPVVLTFCNLSGVNAAPIVTLLIFFVLLSASVTPAASPFAAMMFGNKEWLKPADVYKYASICVVVEFILVLVIGIPFANLMM